MSVRIKMAFVERNQIQDYYLYKERSSTNFPLFMRVIKLLSCENQLFIIERLVDGIGCKAVQLYCT